MTCGPARHWRRAAHLRAPIPPQFLPRIVLLRRRIKILANRRTAAILMHQASKKRQIIAAKLEVVT